MLPHVDTRRLETKGGRIAITVDAVTPPAFVMPSEKLCTGNTVPSDVKYMIHTHMIQHTEETDVLAAAGKYDVHETAVPDRQSADAHVAAHAMPKKIDT